MEVSSRQLWPKERNSSRGEGGVTLQERGVHTAGGTAGVRGVHTAGGTAGVRGVHTAGGGVCGYSRGTYVPLISLLLLTPLRAVQMSDSNIKLREELDQAHSTTRRLNEEVLRLSGELSTSRQRLDAKEREWEEKLKVHSYIHTYVHIYIHCIITYIHAYLSTYVHMCMYVYACFWPFCTR